MNKKLTLSLAIALLGSAFLFGEDTPSILRPQPPAAVASQAQPAVKAKHTPKTTAKTAERRLLQAKGKILRIYPAGKAKGSAERILLLVGDKRMSFVVSGKAAIADAKGQALSPSRLKAGQFISVSYRKRGASKVALTIVA
jgi:hypothetical protein